MVIWNLIWNLGGLTLPNFLHYYWSCHIRKLIYWLNRRIDDECPAWVDMELASSWFSLHSLVCSRLLLAASSFSSNPLVTNSVRIWFQFKKSLHLHRTSDISAILNNLLFLPSCTDLTFRTWSDKGIVKFKDLYNHGTFMSFSEPLEEIWPS